MYERCLNEAEAILSIQQESLMPVRKVWEEIVRRSRVKGFDVTSLSDFSAMLEGDNRFQIIPAQVKRQEDEETPPDIEIEDSEMEQLGFLSEDRVKLRSRRISEPPVSEDDEEVGSIRRKAFAGKTIQLNNISGAKNKKTSAKKSIKKSHREKISHQKSIAGKGKKQPAKLHRGKK